MKRLLFLRHLNFFCSIILKNPLIEWHLKSIFWEYISPFISEQYLPRVYTVLNSPALVGSALVDFVICILFIFIHVAICCTEEICPQLLWKYSSFRSYSWILSKLVWYTRTWTSWLKIMKFVHIIYSLLVTWAISRP